MSNILKNLIPIKYYAFQRYPFDMDAEGYVESSELKDYDRNPWYIKSGGDAPVARKGYVLVRADEGAGQFSWYAVRSGAIYSVVVPHSGLSGGWGLHYPGGGLSATSYDYEKSIEYEDNGEHFYLKRYCW